MKPSGQLGYAKATISPNHMSLSRTDCLRLEVRGPNVAQDTAEIRQKITDFHTKFPRVNVERFSALLDETPADELFPLGEDDKERKFTKPSIS